MVYLLDIQISQSGFILEISEYLILVVPSWPHSLQKVARRYGFHLSNTLAIPSSAEWCHGFKLCTLFHLWGSCSDLLFEEHYFVKAETIETLFTFFKKSHFKNCYPSIRSIQWFGLIRPCGLYLIALLTSLDSRLWSLKTLNGHLYSWSGEIAFAAEVISKTQDLLEAKGTPK